jgi:tRNA(adenine34) deaminase
MKEDDERWMRRALELAASASSAGEVPVGAVVVGPEGLLGEGFNRRVLDGDPLAHAEVVAIRDAASRLGHWRLDACTLYVTLEPCVMCSGVILQSRIQCCVFGALDPRAGGVRSLYQLLEDVRSPLRVNVRHGVLAAECSAILTRFFEAERH